MKRCSYCFRYSRQQVAFCTTCGRSFGVRICSRGHVNPRGVTFCAECGSGELSTPAPPAGFLFHLSQWTLRIAVAVFIAVVLLAAVLGILYSLDWNAITPRLTLLVLMLGFLYWTTTLLPGPIKKVGKALGRKALDSVKTTRKRK